MGLGGGREEGRRGEERCEELWQSMRVCEYAVSFNSNGTRESTHLFPHNATINYFLFSAEAGLAKLAVNGCSSGQRWYPVSLINLEILYLCNIAKI